MDACLQKQCKNKAWNAKLKFRIVVMVISEKEKGMRVTGEGVHRDLQPDLQCLVPFFRLYSKYSEMLRLDKTKQFITLFSITFCLFMKSVIRYIRGSSSTMNSVISSNVEQQTTLLGNHKLVKSSSPEFRFWSQVYLGQNPSLSTQLFHFGLQYDHL